jgi:hypothetical protein
LNWVAAGQFLKESRLVAAIKRGCGAALESCVLVIIDVVGTETSLHLVVAACAATIAVIIGCNGFLEDALLPSIEEV